MPQAIASVQNPYIRQMLEAVTGMYAEYQFFTAPAFEAFDGLSRDYERQYKALLTRNREIYLSGGAADQTGAFIEFLRGVQK
jgi:hypothetical protein